MFTFMHAASTPFLLVDLVDQFLIIALLIRSTRFPVLIFISVLCVVVIGLNLFIFGKPDEELQ